ncbi:unnamed protein product [Rotaria sp. Silwood2]|nr:unnamed protein product [Rotaria sp. Silwood2]CAF3265501.1 unnamed protein product [Rotaria sp. Silwood2]CAF4343697.1 unnamed protein product [Rotaria sp. Silwood2]CAF4663623.1 unnamed protein product [Rotaria sp. Silwood2]CAF4680220.1 unnamed protein product [Rotaria sp. Silwood2]
MARWEVQHQYSGITDVMKTNILSTISTTIDLYGSSEMFKIADNVRSWLDDTYGKHWSLIIFEVGKCGIGATHFESKYFAVKETKLGWCIDMWKQT